MHLHSYSDSVICFGVFQLNLEVRELRKRGLPVRLTHQSFELLAALVENSGEIQTREHLRIKLWRKEADIDFEHSLNKAIHELREALGDSAADPRFIETIPGMGYRFAPVVQQRANDRTKSEHVRSIATLPFNCPGDQPEAGFVSRQLTATLINLLSQESKIRVLAYNTVRDYQYIGKAPSTIGADLAVNYIVLGDIVQEHMQVIISAELIDTRDGALVRGFQRTEPAAGFSERVDHVAAELLRTVLSAFAAGNTGRTHRKMEKPPSSMVGHQYRPVARIRSSKGLVF